MVGHTLDCRSDSPTSRRPCSETKPRPPSSFADPPWLEALSTPQVYPEHTRSVTRIETHISWVFVTDRFVYKLKKPVRFPFLDFSTLEQRLVDCRAEVSLNKRLAPHVYLGVVPVARSPSGHIRVDGQGEVLEWAVKMLRLPAEQSLEHLLRTNRLASLDVARVARLLAEFYDRLPPLTVTTSIYLARFEDHILDNRETLLRCITGDQSSAVLRTHTAQLCVIRMCRELLANRVRDGRIVEGHGDLRPEHVYLVRPPAIIDCVEFNREYRELDVVDDLCFLIMECDRLGARWVGEEVLAHYAAITGDRSEPLLRDFYLSYRASVRAKVHVLRAAQLQGRGRDEAFGDARDYLRLADRYAERIAPPMLLLVTGISGSGKSTLAEHLGRELGIPVLQTDTLRDAVIPRRASPMFDAGRYAPAQRDRVYEELLRQAEKRLEQGVSVILDGTFLRRTWREAAWNVGRRRGAVVAAIQCSCPLDVASRRIAHRTNSPSEAWPELPERQQREYEFDGRLGPHWLVDTTQSLPEQLQTIYQALGNVLFPRMSDGRTCSCGTDES